MKRTGFKPKACDCGVGFGHSSLNCPQKPRATLRRALKPISRIGKQGRRYKVFRDSVAYPALVARDGEKCAMCGKTGVPLDVDHIQKRGSHPELKYEISNLQLLCRPCHNLKDNT